MKISEVLSENNQRIDLKLSTIFDKIDEIPFICWYSANMKKVGDV